YAGFRLVQSEYGNRDQIADKEKRLDKGKSQRSKEDCQKDIEHSFLRVLGADFHDLFAVRDRSLLDAFQFDVGFNEFNRTIRARCDRLCRSASEPVDDRAARNQTQEKQGVEQRQAFEEGRQALGLCLTGDRRSTRLNSSHLVISYAVFCLKKKK